MAEKKFHSPAGVITDDAVAADHDSAQAFDRALVGARGVYYRDGFRVRFLDYGLLERVFIRVQAVNGRMCCGNATFEYCRLVFVSGGKEVADYMSEKASAMDAALARIAACAPTLAIGFVSGN